MTISSTQKRSWTRSWPARAEPLREAGVEEEAGDRGREGDRVVVLDEEAGDAVLDHLGDPADVRRDDRPRQRHRFEDRQALCLAPRRQHGDVEPGGDGRDVVATPREDHPVGDAMGGGPLLEEVPPRALADDQEVGVRAGPQDVRPRLDQGLVALLGLQPGDDADDPAAGLEPELVADRRGALVVVPLQVDPVVDQADRRAGPVLVGDLPGDRAADRDQLVHLRRELADQLAVLRGADPRRVDGRDDVRPAVARSPGGPSRPWSR